MVTHTDIKLQSRKMSLWRLCAKLAAALWFAQAGFIGFFIKMRTFQVKNNLATLI